MVNIIQNIIHGLQRRLLEQAITDPLTGAFNRRHMSTRLREALATGRPPATPSALLMIDVDHFKKINDEHGHDAGDAVLKGLVSVVRSRARKTDLLFRMGGEEFVLLLPDTTETEAMTLADDIREAIASSPLLEGHKVTVSIGVGPADAQDSVDSWLKGDGRRHVRGEGIRPEPRGPPDPTVARDERRRVYACRPMRAEAMTFSSLVLAAAALSRAQTVGQTLPPDGRRARSTSTRSTPAGATRRC